MENFLQEFGEINPDTGKYCFSNVRSGLVVATVSPSHGMRPRTVKLTQSSCPSELLLELLLLHP